MNIDVYVINLPHRKDRAESCLDQLAAAGFNRRLITVIPARYTPRNGAIGCAQSHAYALSRFLFDCDSRFCLIVEDDFAVRDVAEFKRKLTMLLLGDQGWDVLLLASNQAVPLAATPFADVYRVMNAQTTSAYVVTRRYAPTLIRLFFESAARASEILMIMANSLSRHFFAIDVAWKSLQQSDSFYAFLPQIAYQSESFSDIENAQIDYGV